MSGWAMVMHIQKELVKRVEVLEAFKLEDEIRQRTFDEFTDWLLWTILIFWIIWALWCWEPFKKR